MTKIQENKLTMYEGTASVLKSNAAITAKIPAFAPAIQEFEENMIQLKEKNNEFQGKLAGTTANKHTAQNQLDDMLLKISAALTTIARRSQNNVLAEKAKLTKSDLGRFRDTDLINRSTAMHALAVEMSESLVDFGITAANLTELKNQISTYHIALGAREESVASRKAARVSLQDIFARIDEILKADLDNLVELVKNDHPEFYNTYWGARMVKKLGHRSREVSEPPKTTATE
jgi:chromosome segregation ATPase